MPADETLEALDKLVKDGKVVEIGNSNFSGAMIEEADAVARTRGFRRFVSAQNGYNLLDAPPQDGVLEACARHELMFLPCYPLASGLLTGKYRKGAGKPKGSRFDGETQVIRHLASRQVSDERIAKVEKLEAFARDHGRTILELAISWLTSQKIVGSVIAGATSPEQIAANAKAATWDLTERDFRDIADLIS
jgi:aryl-alcohol dehydrogenase-like predicted oxidoreductase